MKARWVTGRISVIAVVFALLVSAAVGQVTYAGGGGALGGTGSGSGNGSGGGAYTKYGYGWYTFATNGGGPGGMRNGGNWATVQSTCRAANASQIIAFIIFVKGGSPQTSIVYNYTGEDYPAGYLGNSGSPWETNATASNQFSSLPSYGVSTSGYTFGQNVAWFCYGFQQNYSLTPSITASPPIVEAGSTVSLAATVSNSGPATSSSAGWQIVRSGIGVSTTIQSGTASFSKGNHSIGSGSDELPDTVPVGTQVCYVVKVQHWNQGTTAWRSSPSSCVTVAKKPTVDVLGGDINSAGDISTSTSIVGGRTYGSWGEYAATATGSVVGFGSGAAYNGGLLGATTCNVSQLIFTNAGAKGCYVGTSLGHYDSLQAIPNVAATFPINSSTPLFEGIGDVANNRVETATGTVVIDGTAGLAGGALSAGQWLVLNAPSATVNITNNIEYTNAMLHSLRDIPQLVIIANCINISGNVSRVDAWLIAQSSGSTCDNVSGGGVLNTCSDVAPGGDLSSTTCSNTVQVNGPVAATHLFLQRTAGADASSGFGAPAEVFNLRPDAYLWLLQQSSASGYMQAGETIQLPPRF